MISRIRTPLQIIGYGLYLYFLDVSVKSAAKALSFLHIVKMSCFNLELDTKVQTKEIKED